mmetsp:Transcript_12315/g.40431  ORF Transcript_12315/g.40431 Transcript_12315/m.40431 type:complete len:752 (-) Transcript_12315:40-2295(-)
MAFARRFLAAAAWFGVSALADDHAAYATEDELCLLINRNAMEQDTPYFEDCRARSLEGGVMIELFRGDAAFSDPYTCDSFLLLPGENLWPVAVRGGLYLFALLYCFLGIAIVADVFMSAIEVITSKEVEKTIVNPETGKEEVIKEKYWNATVANLTLMALGSSAPEILLSVGGVLADIDGEADPLGPGTIVGSAAFNLLVITSVCVVAPVPETRTIEQTGVYACTAIFSIWAYVWLLLMIDFISPEVIELWEAIVTFLHFPVLVFLAYGFDRKWRFSEDQKPPPPTQGNTLEYRMNAVRMITGAPRVEFKRGKLHKEHVPEEEAAPETDAAGFSSDPYAIVTYNGVSSKTKYKKKNLNPKWKEVFGFKLAEGVSTLKLEVMDHDDLSADDFMGCATVDISVSTAKAQEQWVVLADRNGMAGSFGEVLIAFYTSDKTGELIVKVLEGKSLLALEKSSAAMDAVASALGSQARKLKAWYARNKHGWAEMKRAYRQQFETAMRVAGELDDDGNELPPSGTDLLMHFLTIFWKAFFALIPPPDFYGGWLTFGVALIFIGGVTMIVGDLAGLFGCAVGLKTATTAITFVALGTSLPDMFASKVAAVNEETADNAVGNVTGSNGVNVFLGIGLPWTIASVYKTINGEDFIARSNGFGLSVALHLMGAIPFLLVLYIRRRLYGGELGGPKGPANATALFALALWMVYIIGSAFVHYDILSSYSISSIAPDLPPPPAPWFLQYSYPPAGESNGFYKPFK